jgi:hypothetical protein
MNEFSVKRWSYTFFIYKTFYQIQMHLKLTNRTGTEKLFAYDVKCMNSLRLHTQHQYDKRMAVQVVLKA